MYEKNPKPLKTYLITLVVTLLCALSISVVLPTTTHASASKNVMKMLKYYKKGKFSKADAIGKKLANTKANEKKYKKKLSSQARSAYYGVLNSYDTYSFYSNGYLWNYFVKDLDGKGKPELCVIYGTCEADVELRVYKYQNRKAVLVARDYCGHCGWSDLPGKKGVVVTYGHMGDQNVSVMTLKNNKLKYKDYNGHSYAATDPNRDYKSSITFPYRFPEHVTYKSGYSTLSMSGIL